MAYSTLVATFFTTEEAENFIYEERLIGTKVSNFKPRYTIEVPVGKEQHYLSLLQDKAESVNKFFLNGKEPTNARKSTTDRGIKSRR